MATHPHPRTAAEALQTKFDQILPHLDERRRRLYLASEATAIGHGGITLVAAASGTSTATIARGIAELAGQPAPTRRIRVPGGGRKPLTTTDSGLLAGTRGVDRAAHSRRPRLPAALDHAVAARLGIVVDRPGPPGQRHDRRAPAAHPGLQPAGHREDPRGRRPSGPRCPVRPPEPHRRRLPQRQPAGDQYRHQDQRGSATATGPAAPDDRAETRSKRTAIPSSPATSR